MSCFLFFRMDPKWNNVVIIACLCAATFIFSFLLFFLSYSSPKDTCSFQYLDSYVDKRPIDALHDLNNLTEIISLEDHQGAALFFHLSYALRECPSHIPAIKSAINLLKKHLESRYWLVKCCRLIFFPSFHCCFCLLQRCETTPELVYDDSYQ